MSANAIDGKGDAQKPFSFHFNQNNVFHGEEKISEWRNNISTLYPNLLKEEDNNNNNNNNNTMDTDIGGLRIFIRKRPMFTKTIQEKMLNEETNYDTLTMLDPFAFIHSEHEKLGVKNGKLRSIPYRFHGTFNEDSTNHDLYTKTCQPLVNNILNIENTNIENTIICYGQTGGGKTFTQVALIDFALTYIFKKKTKDQILSLSFFENCGDRVFDLSNNRNEMKIQEDANGNVIVNGLKWHDCNSIEEASKIVKEGSKLRATHPTKNNPDSSRSHALCQFLFKNTNNKLIFVDLAGSERKKDVREHSLERIAEMQEINWSLGTLKQCVRDLIEKNSINPKKHLNFRNSKLTLLLKKVFVVGNNNEKKSSDNNTDGKNVTSSNNHSNLSVFIGCVSPLLKDRLHTDATIKYMEELMSVDIYLQNRVATEEELIKHLQLFYLEYCPKKATRELVSSILNKFKGKEYNLYKGIKKKYRHAPKILLMSAGAIDRQKKNPLKWNVSKLKNWMRGLENGKYHEYVERFNISGSKFFSLSVHDIIDRCGGGSHCAAFNDAEHSLYDGVANHNEDIVIDDSTILVNAEKVNDDFEDEKAKIERNAEAGKEIFEAFRKLRIEYNK